jgi:hypothetical protein
MDIKDFIEAVEEDHLDAWLSELSAKDGIMLYLNALEFMKPKRQRTSIDQDENKLPKDIY